MCLAVYIGSDVELSAPPPQKGDIALKLASWKPPFMERFKHVYYVGQKGDTAELGCSCLFLEALVYPEDGGSAPYLERDETYSHAKREPFQALQEACQKALRQGSEVELVCDGEGGIAWEATRDSYENMPLLLEDIRAGNLMFFDEAELFPCKHYVVTL